MFDSNSDTALRLMTIGYEGAVISDFILSLKAANVTDLIDVRELPYEYRQDGTGRRHLGADRVHAAQQDDLSRRHCSGQSAVS